MLTPVELDIMKAVWRTSPITVREVQEAIRPSRNFAYTTVMTMMDRMFHKGLLTRTLRSRTHYYEPVIHYSDARDEALQRLINSYFGSKEKLKEFLEGEVAGSPLPAAITQKPPTEISPPALDETLL
jgi:BlaI family penicillinase repressor